jgi:hypothetical protein
MMWGNYGNERLGLGFPASWWSSVWSFSSSLIRMPPILAASPPQARRCQAEPRARQSRSSISASAQGELRPRSIERGCPRSGSTNMEL